MVLRGIETDEPVEPAEPEFSVAAAQGGVVVELIAQQAAVTRVGADFFGFGVELHQAIVGAEPKPSFAVFENPVCDIVGHSLPE